MDLGKVVNAVVDGERSGGNSFVVRAVLAPKCDTRSFSQDRGTDSIRELALRETVVVVRPTSEPKCAAHSACLPVVSALVRLRVSGLPFSFSRSLGLVLVPSPPAAPSP